MSQIISWKFLFAQIFTRKLNSQKVHLYEWNCVQGHQQMIYRTSVCVVKPGMARILVVSFTNSGFVCVSRGNSWENGVTFQYFPALTTKWSKSESNLISSPSVFVIFARLSHSLFISHSSGTTWWIVFERDVILRDCWEKKINVSIVTQIIYQSNHWIFIVILYPAQEDDGGKMCPLKYLFYLLLFLLSNVLLASCAARWKASFEPSALTVKTSSKERVRLVLSGISDDTIAHIKDREYIQLRSENTGNARVDNQAEVVFFEVERSNKTWDAMFDVTGVFIGE